MLTKLISISIAALFPILGYSQGRSIALGECLDSTLATQSSSITYITPVVSPGDILLIRVKESGVILKFELYSPTGTLLQTVAGVSTADLLQTTYTVPANGSGAYKIIVSTSGFFTGPFSISLNRMNEPPGAIFLECNASLSGHFNCGPVVIPYRFLVQQNARSRIKVSPLGSALEVWVCEGNGNVLRHIAADPFDEVLFDTIPATQTGCYYVLVASSDGFFFNNYNVSHTLITGDCAAPTLQLTPSNGSVCEGSSFSFSVSSPLQNATYNWSGPNGFTSTQSNISFDNATLSMSGNYVVTVTVPGVCPSVLTRTISVKALPTADASVTPASASVCAGQSFKLDVSSNTTGVYHWSGPASYSSNIKSPTINNANPGQTGMYHISVTDVNGCVGQDSIFVTVNAPPTATVTSLPANGKVCLGSDLQLSVSTNAQNPMFLWKGPLLSNFNSALQNPIIENVQYENGGTYTVTVTDGVTGCSSTATKSITINMLPNADISANPSSVCTNASTHLSGCCNAQSYLWSTGETTMNITATPTQTGYYYLTITDANGCTDTDSTLITVKQRPSISIISTPENPEICAGDGQVLLCGTSNGMQTSWLWTAPGYSKTDPCISLSTPQQSAIYTVKVTDGMNGCTNTTSIEVKIHALPVVSILESPASPYCEGVNFTLCANSTPTGTIYEWSGPNGFASNLFCPILNNTSIVQSGIYFVTVTDNYGCSGTKSANIIVNPRAVATIAGDLSICSGTTTVLTAAGGGTYHWSNNATTAGITISPLSTSIYSVTVTNIYGCTDETSATVLVTPNTLQLSVESSQGNIQASASGGQAPYAYSIFPQIMQFPGQPGLFLNAPFGVYTITVIDAAGCSQTKTFSHTSATVEPEAAWGISVSPNPGSGVFYINILKDIPEGLHVGLFSHSGQMLKQLNIENAVSELNLSDLPNGFYILRFSDGNNAGAVQIALIR